MKIKLLFIAILFSGLSVQAQEITANVSMGAGYSKQVFYKLDTETTTNFPANLWDVAFLRISNYAMDIRVNHQTGTQVFEATNNSSDWDNIDVTNEDNWTVLYNSDILWQNGAFSQGSATYGFGEYNPATHHVTGTVIFVLKYADGTYVKFINEDFYGGYTFKYSTWSGTAWSADTTFSIPNTNHPDNRYNYYSFLTHSEVVAEPAITDWDFVFTKYFTDMGSQYYNVSGVLHNSTLTVAQKETQTDTANLNYSDEINTIGYDWKTFGGSGYTVNSDRTYYIKNTDNGNIYKLYFTNFEGSSTGNISFNFENVSNQLEVTSFDMANFSLYPNPSVGKKINLIYDINTANIKTSVVVFNLEGKQVFKKDLKTTQGFYEHLLDLSHLRSGIYLIQFSAGNKTASQKLILQ